MIAENKTKHEHYTVIAFNLGLLFLLLSIVYATLSAFIGVFTYAVIFSVTLYGGFEKAVTLLGNRRKLAGYLYGLILVGVIAIPLIMLITKLVDSFHGLREFISGIQENNVPPLPDKVANLPWVGKKVQHFWLEVEQDPAKAIEIYGSQLKGFFKHILLAGGGVIGATLELIIGIIISAVVLTIGGKKVIEPLIKIMHKLMGAKQGEALVGASGRAIKGVAIGVMGTGLIEAFLAWIGFSIAGLSTAAILAALTFLLVVIQLGPVLVVVPVVIYLAQTGQSGMAVFVGIVGVLLAVVDNVIKPILIGKSGQLPVLVLFLGVIGGLAAWGFTGMFKGAIVMALLYTLTQAWLREVKEEKSLPLETS